MSDGHIMARLYIFWSLVLALVTANARVCQAFDESDVLRDVQSIYRGLHGAAIWTPSRRSVLETALQERAHNGLPADAACPTAADVTDEILTACLVRLVLALRIGIVSNSVLGTDWQLVGPEKPDMPDLLSALDGNHLPDYIASQPPNSPEYQSLRAELARVTSEAEKTEQSPQIPTGKEILLDGTDARVDLVRQKLVESGDLSANNTGLGSDAIRFALKRFQSRFGLDPDGRAGPATIAALNLDRTQIAARIAVALERMRHEPRDFPADRVEANIAEAKVRYIQHGMIELEMRAIVGDPQHPTPVFSAKITAVTLNPAWTIPQSIAVNEILPKLRRDSAYLRDNGIRILGDSADPYGVRVNWSQVSRTTFHYRMRQDPGEKNPLGTIKFEMANLNDVYLHDTPAKQLFARSRRTLSHGCVRLEDAATLASRLEVALGIQPGGKSVTTSSSETLVFTHALPVYVRYRTAFVDGAKQLSFAPDVYNRDSAVAAALGYTLDRLANHPVRDRIACGNEPGIG